MSGPGASRASRVGTRPTWSVAADVGGTWLRVIARASTGRPARLERAPQLDRTRRRFHEAPAPGLPGLPDALDRLWRRWHLERASVGALVVASRGVWTARERRALERRLVGLAVRVRAIPDVEAAHRGALGGGPGVLILAGTGSIALARDAAGRWARAGGLGPLLGDEGSAFWIGREWLRAGADGARFALIRRMLSSPDPVARIAALAPAVLRRTRAHRGEARDIAGRAQDALAALIASAAARLRIPEPVDVSWGGGLLQAERFRAGVWRAARRQGLELRVRPPRESALEAAARLAAALAGAGRAAR